MDFQFLLDSLVYIVIAIIIYFGGGYVYWYWMRADHAVEKRWKEMTKLYQTSMMMGWPVLAISTLVFWIKNRFKKKTALASKSRSRANVRSAVTSSKKRVTGRS